MPSERFYLLTTYLYHSMYVLSAITLALVRPFVRSMAPPKLRSRNHLSTLMPSFNVQGILFRLLLSYISLSCLRGMSQVAGGRIDLVFGRRLAEEDKQALRALLQHLISKVRVGSVLLAQDARPGKQALGMPPILPRWIRAPDVRDEGFPGNVGGTSHGLRARTDSMATIRYRRRRRRSLTTGLPMVVSRTGMLALSWPETLRPVHAGSYTAPDHHSPVPQALSRHFFPAYSGFFS